MTATDLCHGPKVQTDMFGRLESPVASTKKGLGNRLHGGMGHGAKQPVLDVTSGQATGPQGRRREGKKNCYQGVGITALLRTP